MQYTNNHRFKGKWITSAEFAELEKINVFHRYLDEVSVPKSEYRNCHILFRRRFELDCTNNAKIIIGADDCFKLYINGEFVTECFSQTWREVDVEKYLHAGENLLAVHTYYQGLINRVFVSGDNCHGLICDLLVDGETVLTSDEEFLYSYHDGYISNGIIGCDTQFAEIYDANAKQVGFEKADFDDSDWAHAKVRKDGCTLFSTEAKLLVFEKIKPKLLKTDYGWFADFSANYVGYFNLTAKGEKGGKITLRFGQELDENGRVKFKMRAGCDYEDIFILSGNSDDLRQFDYKAFRYAEIILPEDCEIDESSVSLTARHYPFEAEVRTFDNDELEKIRRLCVHTLKYGVQETVQDCPDREKGYYLGDGCYIALTFGKLTGDRSLFRQLVRDALRTKSVSPSLLTCLNCSLIQEIAEFPLITVIAVKIYFSMTGDRAFVDEIINELRAVLDYYKNEYTNGGLITKIDKWCVVEWPENFRDNYDVELEQNKYLSETHCVINAYYYAALCAFNELAGETVYDTAKIKNAYLNAFFDSGKPCFRDSVHSNRSSLVSNLFSYAFDLCPDSQTEEKIIAEFERRGINSVNMFTAFPVLHKLKSDGRDISKHLLNPNAWLNMLAEGATATFETWGKEQKWNTSLFHLTLSYAAFFI